jgi:hypothetical protein
MSQFLDIICAGFLGYVFIRYPAQRLDIVLILLACAAVILGGRLLAKIIDRNSAKRRRQPRAARVSRNRLYRLGLRIGRRATAQQLGQSCR